MPPDPAVNSPFTGLRFFRIGHGRLAGQLKDIAHQDTTATCFRGSTEALGGPRTHAPGGAFNRGKARTGHVAAVGHGGPAALFLGVSVLNTTQEAGR